MSETVIQFIKGIDPALKAALAAEVARRDGNLNDVVVGALADHFTFEGWEPTGRRAGGPISGTTVDLALRMPEALRRRIRVAATERGRPARTLILSILSDRFGAGAPAARSSSAPRARRPRRSAAAA